MLKNFLNLSLRIKLFVSLLILSFFSLVYIFINLKSPVINSLKYTPTPYKNTIYPGKSTSDQVVKELGQPQSTADWQGQTILNYPSDSKWKNQVFTEGQKVTLVTEQVTKTSPLKKSDYIKEFGQPEIILYGPLSPVRDLYTYPSRGFAFLGSKNNESLFQLWYFPPQSVADFVNKVAIEFEYSPTPPQESE